MTSSPSAISNGEVRITIFEQPQNPINYLCPISLSPMHDPVMTSCGHIFERVMIIQWLDQKGTCPLDRQRIQKADLIPQERLQAEIQAYLVGHPEEDNSEEDEKIPEEYSSFQQTFFQSIGRHFPNWSWRNTLLRTHRLALACFIVSTSTFIVMNLDDQSVEATNLASIRNGACYFMFGSVGLTMMTSDSFIQFWNAFQDRRSLRNPDE